MTALHGTDGVGEEIGDDVHCVPPVRAFDATLPQRIARGDATVWDARQVQGLMVWMQRYEQALRHIAVHGDRESARVAMMAITVGHW
ncbi:hypothetical protein [Azohydromonas sediminis]|uniref:hypothetical protein n=1 Tax=Azohydromonas sediminis TaxID=2259674 RepID=UPI001F3E4BD9|nr:hypothetical protein [Azohydromonas sediminis]